jgi:hypothetical protein
MYDRSRIRHFSAVHPRFNAGRVFVTATALEAVGSSRLRDCLGRHLRGDWGVIDARSAASNVQALHANATVWSVYALDPTTPCSATDNCVWIVTHLDRSETELLLPSDRPTVVSPGCSDASTLSCAAE